MPTIIANGLTVAYDVVGAGPPLVVLHGATTAGRQDLGPHLDTLAERFTVYLPDARGHGGSGWGADRGVATVDLVADVGEFADGLGLDTFHLLGFSMGAMTALHVAATWPARVLTLVVAGISPMREPRLSVVGRTLDTDRIEHDDPGWARFLRARHGAEDRGRWRELLPAIVADVATQRLLTAAELHAIDPPTLVAVGDRDPFAPVAQVVDLARAIPNSRLHVVPDAGHEVLTERPAVVGAALADFYRETQDIARRRAEYPPEVAR
jgi:pimeloyl-ACP methyl ester carboxylesterase